MAKRIFVVDDEELIADTTVVILQRSGYEAQAFYNAQSALAQFASCPPDLMISDVMMPGMNGTELAVLVREHYPECKILLFSGNAATSVILETAQAQGHNFECLAKPVSISVLLARIEEA